jgi:hypothetical protein
MLYMVKKIKMKLNDNVITCIIYNLIKKPVICVKYMFNKKIISLFQIKIEEKDISNKFVKEFDKKTAKELYSINQEVL